MSTKKVKMNEGSKQAVERKQYLRSHAYNILVMHLQFVALFGKVFSISWTDDFLHERQK